jgi:hypothetical protein
MAQVLEFPTLPDIDQYPLGCADSLDSAKSFIMSCITALESGQSSNFNARFETYVRHRAECEKCNEVRRADSILCLYNTT